MANTVRVYVFLIILPALIVVIAVLASIGPTSLPLKPLSSAPTVDLIAYVDLRGQIHTIASDGSQSKRISPEEGVFTWPAWSQDASRIAFSGVRISAGSPSALTMLVSPLNEGGLETIYVNESGMGPILRGMPHYPLWSPDDTRLAIMASHPDGLTLLLDDQRVDADAEVVLRLAPLYVAWSADSRYLMVHGGPRHFLVDVVGGVTPEDIGTRSARYRAPAWWPSGNKLALVIENSSGLNELFIIDMDTGEQTLVDEVPGEAAFMWSPNGGSLAVAHSQIAGGFIYSGVTLYSTNGTLQTARIEEDVLAYFWSPDSTKLAYVTPADTRGVLRWNVLNVEEQSQWALADFVPSQDQMSMFQFLDQFAHSHSLWSPDSNSIVFAGTLQGEAFSASLNRQPASQVIVSDIEPYSFPQPIAEGSLAVWSPR